MSFFGINNKPKITVNNKYSPEIEYMQSDAHNRNIFIFLAKDITGNLQGSDIGLPSDFKKNIDMRDKLDIMKHYSDDDKINAFRMLAQQYGDVNVTGDHEIITVQIPNGNKTINIILDKNTGEKIQENTRTVTEDRGFTKVNVISKRYVNGKIHEKNTSFKFSKDVIEDYIIHEAKDNDGKKVYHFSSIPKIREKSEDERTHKEKALLNEFENMVNFCIDAGMEYGIDPKLILSIIQQEVMFKGLNGNVNGVNGKGYMQITRNPLMDYMGFSGDGKLYSIRKTKYGPEMEELLISRGFNPNEPKNKKEREEFVNKISNYLYKNKDAEFNIRLGTIILRQLMDKHNGDIKTAALKYNGSKHKAAYSEHVSGYYRLLEDKSDEDSTYNCTNY